MKRIQISIYPQDNYSLILVFLERINFIRYKGFIKQFNKYTDAEKLHLISNIVITYAEDFYISPLISSSVFENSILQSMSTISTDIVFGLEMLAEGEFYKKIYKMFSVIAELNTPNLLSEEHAVELKQ